MKETHNDSRVAPGDFKGYWHERERKLTILFGILALGVLAFANGTVESRWAAR